MDATKRENADVEPRRVSSPTCIFMLSMALFGEKLLPTF